MSDDNDFKIETADAGASATIPMEAGQIKKGGWVLRFLEEELVVSSIGIFDMRKFQWHKNSNSHVWFYFLQIHDDQGKAMQGPQYLCFQDRKARTRQV